VFLRNVSSHTDCRCYIPEDAFAFVRPSDSSMAPAAGHDSSHPISYSPSVCPSCFPRRERPPVLGAGVRAAGPLGANCAEQGGKCVTRCDVTGECGSPDAFVLWCVGVSHFTYCALNDFRFRISSRRARDDSEISSAQEMLANWMLLGDERFTGRLQMAARWCLYWNAGTAARRLFIVNASTAEDIWYFVHRHDCSSEGLNKHHSNTNFKCNGPEANHGQSVVNTVT
jgi:hypothetical protein